MAFTDWSTDANANTTVGSVSIAEGMAPSGVNNAIREVMAELRAAFSTALSSLFSATDVIIARNALGAAGAGANADITSLTGLTTPLTRAQVPSSHDVLRLAQGGSIAGNGTLVTLLSGTLTLTAPAYVDIDISFNQSNSAGPKNCAAQILVDGNQINSVGTGAIFQTPIAFGDTLALGVGAHTFALAVLAADATVSIYNGRLRARALY